MYGRNLFFSTLIKFNLNAEPSDQPFLLGGGLFLVHETICPSFVSLISSNTEVRSSRFCRKTLRSVDRRQGKKGKRAGFFLSASLSIKEESYDEDSRESLGQNGNEKNLEEENAAVVVEEKTAKERRWRSVSGSAALNTTKHLWVGAVAAMVSRTFIAPSERMKLEYVVRGEQKDLFELINTIKATEGLKGFWKRNFVNILRTAPFKSINFYAYDTYRS